MPKARIFISSTCYDLSKIRSEIDMFLANLNFEVLNSEKGVFGVTPGVHSHSACIDQVNQSDYVLLIVGGRRGGTFIGSEKSITNEEFNVAMKRGIPIITCVENDVMNTLPTYKKNQDGNFSHVVDDIRVFHFIDYVTASSTDNWIHSFKTIDEIKVILASQFSHYLHKYSLALREPNKKVEGQVSVVELPPVINDLPGEDQDSQTFLKNGLKNLHSIISSIVFSEIKNDNKLEQLKCLWVIALHGEMTGEAIHLDEPIFKLYAWSTSKGNRVFKQMSAFGIKGEYYDNDVELFVSLAFEKENEDTAIAGALKYYVCELHKKYQEDGLALFKNADMRMFSK